MELMSSVYRLLVAVIAVITVFFSGPAMAQTTPESLVGFWLGTVEGEAAARSLVITKEAPTNDGALLSAKYGMASKGVSPIEAEMRRIGDQRQMVLISQAGTIITVTEQPDKKFQGTFALKTGVTKSVAFTRVTEDELQSLIQAKAPASQAKAATPTLMQVPGPDVPAACASFVGGWTGNWSFGKRWLWVTEVDAKCVARYSYGPQKPTGLKSAEIKDGKFAFPCGKAGGTCYFTNHGDELWAGYGGSDGQNSTVFQKTTDSSL
jgi:hypothetical protein